MQSEPAAARQLSPGELIRVRLVPLATGLEMPRHVAFLPSGRDLLIAETPGTLRLLRAGEREAVVVNGWPPASLEAGSLQSVLVHPRFEQNHFIYLSYVKRRADGLTTVALARGQLQDTTVSDVTELFVAEGWVMGGPVAARAEFGPDGMVS